MADQAQFKPNLEIDVKSFVENGDRLAAGLDIPLR